MRNNEKQFDPWDKRNESFVLKVRNRVYMQKVMSEPPNTDNEPSIILSVLRTLESSMIHSYLRK